MKGNILYAARDGLILFLKTYFLFHPVYKWSPDAKERKIIITDAYALSDKDLEKLPCIVVQRFQTSLAPGTFPHNLKEYDLMKTGKQEKAIQVISRLRINCIASDGLTAEALANEITGIIISFSDVLNAAGYQNVQVFNIGPEEPMELAGTTIIRSSVSVDLQVSYALRLSIETKDEFMKKLKKIYIKSLERWIEPNGNLLIEEIIEGG
ncbi:MAG: hypothetical protein QXO15_09750 [Nitrososphaerota archaeon]